MQNEMQNSHQWKQVSHVEAVCTGVDADIHTPLYPAIDVSSKRVGCCQLVQHATAVERVEYIV